jgi:Mn-containing catalase
MFQGAASGACRLAHYLIFPLKYGDIMFSHNKRLQYTVRVDESNPGLANLMLEQFGGPQGELAAACRYFSQYLAEDDPGRKDMLIDIATEELSHLEVIGTIVAMLNKGAKGRIAEGVDSAAELYRGITAAGNDSHVTQVLYGGGPAFTNSAGVPWTAAYVDSIGDPTCDLRSNIAAEARAKIVYERLINCTDDPGVKEALGFLMTREIAHQQSFEKALYSIQPNFPPGKLPGMPEFTNVYFKMSTGNGDLRGPWSSEPTFEVREAQVAVDGGDGRATVKIDARDMELLESAAIRLKSDPASDPVTGAMLGMDEGEALSGNGHRGAEEIATAAQGPVKASQESGSNKHS